MKTKRFAFHLSLFALAAVLTLAACSKDQPANEGTVPVTEEELLGKWVFDSTSIGIVDQTLTILHDTLNNKRAMLYSGIPDMSYEWYLDDRTIVGQAIYPDSYLRQTLTVFVRGINLLITELEPEEGEEEEEPNYDTAVYMMVNCCVTDTRLGALDTMYTFSGTLWKQTEAKWKK